MKTQAAAGLGTLALVCVLLTGLATPPKTLVLQRLPSEYNGQLIVLDYNGTRALLARSKRSQVLEGAMDLSDPARLKIDYLEVMSLMTALHPHPEQVFNLGLGAGALVRFHLKQYPTSHVESAEIDPAVIGIATKYFGVSNPRHTILAGEGFQVLKMQKEKFDAVWVDAVSPKEGPHYVMSSDSLHILRDRLKQGGIIVANLGESKKVEPFNDVATGYREGYKYGIRVKSPVSQTDLWMTELRAAAGGPYTDVPSRLPAQFIAVGNNPALTCANFWATYKKFAAEKLVNVRWDDARGSCQDL